MKKYVIRVMVGIAFTAAAGMAFAQLGGFGGGAKGVSADQIVKKYVGGAQSVATADSNLLESIGLKEESARAALEAKNLTDGATKEQLEEALKVQTDNSKSLEDHLNGKKIVMDAASKKLFAQGMLNLAKGLIQYVGMASDVKGFKPSVTSIGASAGSAIFIAKSLPDSITNLSSTLKSAIAFAKSNDIPVPKEATDMV